MGKEQITLILVKKKDIEVKLNMIPSWLAGAYNKRLKLVLISKLVYNK